MLEGCSRSDKKIRFSKFDPNYKRSGCNNKAKWCEKYKNKHFGRGDREVTCYRCRRVRDYSKYFMFNYRVCYGCGDKGHILKIFPKKNEATRPNVSLKPHIRPYHMFLEETNVAT